MKSRSMYLNLLKRGIVLGIALSSSGSVLFWAIFVALGGITDQTNAYEPFDPRFLVLMFAIVTVFVMLIPGAIAGAANAWVQIRMLSGNRHSRITSVFSGLLVGFLTGFVPLLGLVVCSQGSLEAEDMKYLAVATCIATLSGGWHSWVLGRCLQKHEHGGSQTGQG